MNRKHYLNGQKRLLTEDFTECIPGIVYILAPYIWLPLSNNWFLDKTLISRVSGLEWDSPFKWIIHLKNFQIHYNGTLLCRGNQSMKWHACWCTLLSIDLTKKEILFVKIRLMGVYSAKFGHLSPMEKLPKNANFRKNRPILQRNVSNF